MAACANVHTYCCVTSWPSCSDAHRLSWGPSAAREWNPEDRASWQLPLNGCLANLINRLCVWEIINFRKTKCVRLFPGASNCFCVFETRSVECDDILKAIRYLLIPSLSFLYLSFGLKGFALIRTQIHPIYSPGRLVQKERLAGGRYI